MRLLMLLTQSLESPSGLGRYLPITEAFVEAGHDVEIVALHHDWASLPASARQRTIRGVRISYVGQMQVLKRDGQKHYFSPGALILLMLRATWLLFWRALTARTDIIVVGKAQPMNGCAGWVAARLRRRPLWLDVDDHEAASNRFSAAWQRAVVDWMERWLPRRADWITVNTSDSLARLGALGVPTRKLVLLPNGWSRQRFGQEVVVGRKEAPTVLYVGSLSLPSHPVHLLLEAWPAVLRHHPTAQLLIVGSGEEYERVVRLSKQLEIEESVTFAGWIPPDDVPSFYARADVTVDPVHEDDSARGRSPLKLFESLAMGIPVVTADVGDRARIVGRAGVLVEPGSADALAQGILSILDQRGQWQAQAQAQAAPFEWSHQLQPVIPKVRQLIDE